MALDKSELKCKLWQAADILRGQIDAGDYKNYLFWILFLKRLSDRFDEEVESAVKSGVARDIALTDRDYHEFFVPESGRWSSLTGDSTNLGKVLNIASHAIEKANTPRLDGLLTGTDWDDESRLGGHANRECIIRSLLTHFSGLDLSDGNLAANGEDPGNVLGDAYEYLIHEFAGARGESYTPRSVVRLIVELLQPEEGMRICDPTAGSAGMLICTSDYVQEHGGDRRKLVLHGQEYNPKALAIGKLNLLLHGLTSARLEAGDVIKEPGLVDDSGCLLSYDRVIADPPFGLNNWGQDCASNDSHNRFGRYGAIPPKTRGDFAFLLHMLGVTNSHGMVGVVMPQGILFRGGTEGKIRRGVIEDDLFEAVIGLAPNLFSGTSIPVVICVLNRDKPSERRGKVLFIDSAQEGYFRQGRARNFLDREHIGKIADAYHGFEDVERFAYVADLDEIEENDFNLNISRYVDTSEPVDEMSIGDALADVRELERRRDVAVSKVDALLAELGHDR